MTPDRELNPPADRNEECGNCGEHMGIGIYKTEWHTKDSHGLDRTITGCTTCEPKEPTIEEVNADLLEVAEMFKDYMEKHHMISSVLYKATVNAINKANI